MRLTRCLALRAAVTAIPLATLPGCGAGDAPVDTPDGGASSGRSSDSDSAPSLGSGNASGASGFSSGGSASGGSASGGMSTGSSGGAASGSVDAGSPDSGGSIDAGSPADGAEEGGSFPAPEAGGFPMSDAGAKLVSLFDGTTLNGWIQVPAASWSVVNGAMHSLGPARGLIYTTSMFGDFRLVFTSRLISDPANHNPCVLFWGNSIGADALAAIQIQPPKGYMWDYRRTGPTANKSPDMFETKLPHPNLVSTQWSQCEMLANQATGTLRFACCQIAAAAAPCRATEIIDFHDPTAGLKAPLALQVHNANMIEEFKDLYVESPVADPTKLITTQ